jgi:hypothetical protein
MIYCVIPPELKDELYETLVAHYSDNPNVEVILDRRAGPDRRQSGDTGDHERREIRDRRRARVPGTFPSTDPPEAA